MPTLFEYLGIVIRFYSNEHEPIHIHAIYRDTEVVVSLFVKENAIYSIRYKEIKGKFPAAKMKDLRAFIAKYKYAILLSWNQFFEHKVRMKPIIITKRLK